jgi:hypothetical protein
LRKIHEGPVPASNLDFQGMAAPYAGFPVMLALAFQVLVAGLCGPLIWWLLTDDDQPDRQSIRPE